MIKPFSNFIREEELKKSLFDSKTIFVIDF